MSRIIGEVAPDYLEDFSFSNAAQFRQYDESLVRDLDIPEAAWEPFWAMVNKNEFDWLPEVPREEKSYSLYRHLSGRVVENFRSGPGPYVRLSPFKWWKQVVAGVGCVLGIADGVLVPGTGGIAITSFVASVIASG